MSKFSGFWVLFLVLGTTYLSLCCSGSLIPDMDSVTMKAASRKLKVNGYTLGSEKKMVAGTINLEDYHPIDPVPNSKASIKPGPIQHGTPLIPFIPKPSPPPGHPKIERTKKSKRQFGILLSRHPHRSCFMLSVLALCGRRLEMLLHMLLHADECYQFMESFIYYCCSLGINKVPQEGYMRVYTVSGF